MKVYVCVKCFNGHVYNEENVKVVDSLEKAEQWIEENPIKGQHVFSSTWNQFEEFELE